MQRGTRKLLRPSADSQLLGPATVYLCFTLLLKTATTRCNCSPIRTEWGSQSSVIVWINIVGNVFYSPLMMH